MANAYTHKYGATRHKELLEEFTTRNQTIAELADSLRPPYRIPTRTAKRRKSGPRCWQNWPCR